MVSIKMRINQTGKRKYNKNLALEIKPRETTKSCKVKKVKANTTSSLTLIIHLRIAPRVEYLLPLNQPDKRIPYTFKDNKTKQNNMVTIKLNT